MYSQTRVREKKTCDSGLRQVHLSGSSPTLSAGKEEEKKFGEVSLVPRVYGKKKGSQGDFCQIGLWW